MERLGSLDAVFLAIETDTCPMCAGQVSVFEGPAPDLGEIRAFVEGRVRAVPRCRQRVVDSWMRLTRPVWVDDPNFVIDRHVRHGILPSPTPDALDAFVEQVMTVPLERDRPPWELWVIDDVGGGRWAVVGKVHHCMVDGIAGTDLLSVLLGDQQGPVAEQSLSEAAAAPTAPTAPAVVWFGLRAALRSSARHLVAVAQRLRHPVVLWRRLREVAAGARALWLQPPRRNSPLTGPIGTGRRWAHTSVPLADVTAVRRVHGGSVNDVVLAATAFGFRALLQSRGVDERHDVMTLMPISTRAPTARGLLDNRVAVTHALLPVDTDDPVEALHRLTAHLAEVKASHQTDASTVLLHSGDLAPNRVAAAIARGVVRTQRNLETVTTNVPGPQRPLHLCGRQMLEGWPFAPIAGQIRIVVAIWSYCGTLFIGVTGDADGAGDVDVLVAGMAEGFRRLLSSSRAPAA